MTHKNVKKEEDGMHKAPFDGLFDRFEGCIEKFVVVVFIIGIIAFVLFWLFAKTRRIWGY
ncbi:MAG: hypothetical protein AAGA77_19375 [Bacteroidota bacterium]